MISWTWEKKIYYYDQYNRIKEKRERAVEVKSIEKSITLYALV